jgi:thioredoxin reductase (NADPH)
MGPPDPLAQRREQMFPRLSAEQIARIAGHGVRRPAARGDILFDQGTECISFYVVLAGRLEIVRPHEGAEEQIVVHGPGGARW